MSRLNMSPDAPAAERTAKYKRWLQAVAALLAEGEEDLDAWLDALTAAEGEAELDEKECDPPCQVPKGLRIFCHRWQTAKRIQERLLNNTRSFTTAIERYSDRLVSRLNVQKEQVFSEDVSRHARRRTKESEEAGGVGPDSTASVR